MVVTSTQRAVTMKRQIPRSEWIGKRLKTRQTVSLKSLLHSSSTFGILWTLQAALLQNGYKRTREGAGKIKQSNQGIGVASLFGKAEQFGSFNSGVGHKVFYNFVHGLEVEGRENSVFLSYNATTDCLHKNVCSSLLQNGMMLAALNGYKKGIWQILKSINSSI